MKRTSILTFTLLLVFAAAAVAQVRLAPAPHFGPVREFGPVPRFVAAGGDFAEYLGLTAEQQVSWRSIQSELLTSMQALHERERALHDDLDTALDGTDATAIGTLMLQIKGVQSQIDAARKAADAKFRTTLTPEQQTKFDALRAAADYLHVERRPRG